MRTAIDIFYFTILMAALLLISIAVQAKAPNSEIVQTVIFESNKHNLDPALVLAIMKVESSFNQRSIGSAGEIGLMQLHPQFHPQLPNNDDNIAYAVRYLATLKRSCELKYGDAWFVCYNSGPNRDLERPTHTSYYGKVIKAKKEVAQYVRQ